MLAQQVVSKYPGTVKFVSENYGESKLADKFGVTRYPAVFVDDVLVARPRDFGFFGTGENKGRYTPWRNADNQAKFQSDLTRMIDLVLSGKKSELARERGSETADHDDIAALPAFHLTDLSGKPLTPEQVKGRTVVVEFWATWCPPCRSTLEWLGTLQQQHGDDLAVLALAVESPDKDVKALANASSPGVRWAIADADTARAFGDIVSVPTMFIFDRNGRTARVLYGAPPDLHEQAEKTLASILNPASSTASAARKH
ncbi:MAG TPA: TlpA disulfide reductase family protein [Terriglobales bacterium]